ncbi:antibiotic biosynthesis monooxygenase family protein [Streptomyces sp. NPDC060053]|uniref:antibiotic biosynthesis monooxygenase family protein n=1 Tax=Streptomyces sp. NPDC060053 TaxID=3347047 RepID=UPI00368A566A
MTRPAPEPEAGLVTFDVLVADGAETVPALVARITDDTTLRLRHSPGFLSSRVHVSADGRSVITRSLWRSEQDHREALRTAEPADGRRSPAPTTTAFRGRPAPAISGPALGRPPEVVAVATRHLRHPDCFPLLMDLLEDSAEWKRHHRGFISATPHLGLDGTTFVNYPMWADEDSYRAWMADPRISEGQEEIARLEAAEPEYLLCTVAAHIDAA